MISLDKLPLYIPKNIKLNFKDKPYVINFLSDNLTLADILDYLNTPKQVRYVTASYYKSFRPTKYLYTFKDYHLLPVTIEEISKINEPVFNDLTFYINQIKERYNVTSFRTTQGIRLLRPVLESSFKNKINILLYSIDVSKPFPLQVFNRVIWPWIYITRRNIAQNAFDYVILYVKDNDKHSFTLLAHKNKYNIQRIISALKSIKPRKIGRDQIETIIEESGVKDKKLKQLITNYLLENPSELQTVINDKSKIQELKYVSVLYYKYNDVNKAKEILKKDRKKAIEISNALLEHVIISDKSKVMHVVNPVLNTTDFRNLLSPPDIVYSYKFNDFVLTIKKDLQNMSSFFEKGEYKLKLTNIRNELVKDEKSEIQDTILNKITMIFKDEEGKSQEVSFKIPVPKGNIFRINGKDYVLVNQLASKPITFPKKYQCVIRTSYSTIQLEALRPETKYEFIRAFIGGMRIPVALLYFYKIGIDKTFNLFNITDYKITGRKENKAYTYLQLADKFIEVKNFNELNRLQKSILRSINRINWKNLQFSKNGREFWNNVLIEGYDYKAPMVIENILNNILDQTSKDVLKVDGLPTDILSLMKFGCSKLLEGVVIPRNDLTSQRIRHSELLMQYIQKHLLSAYNAYCAKRTIGVKDAKLEINNHKLLVDIITDPNLQPLERVSPLEELSFVARLTPTGFGGLPTKDAITALARNIHPTYAGTISPCDTPESGSVGAIQHLTVGATINDRGVLSLKEINDNLGEKILSPLEALIPFVHLNDGARVLFATNQMRSSIPLRDGEPPIVCTGYEAILPQYLSDKFLKRSPCDGVVSDINKTSVTITCNNGQKKKVNIKDTTLRSGQIIDIRCNYKPIVNVGQTVNKNSVIANGVGVRDNMLSFGKNVHVAILPYKGYNFEDAIVVSESACSMFTSEHIDKVEIQIKDNYSLISVLDVGEVKAGDVLCSFIPGNLSELLEQLDENIDTVNDNVVKIRAQMDGYISQIEVLPGSLSALIRFPLLKPLYEKYAKEYKEEHGVEIPKTFKWRGKSIDGVILRFHIVYTVPLATGDKLANRHGNKGTVGLVLPDNQMPKSPFGRLDVLLNPLGIVSRMNVGQVLELYCGLISHVLSNILLKYDRTKAVKIIEKVYSVIDYDAHSSVISRLKNMSPDEWSDLLSKIERGVYKLPIIVRPFKCGMKEIKLALNILKLKPKYKVFLPEFNSYTLSPVPVGWMYIEKLEHISKWKLHARSVRSYVSKTLQPPAGKRKEGGQRLGELESWGFLSYDAPKLFWEFWSALSDDHISKNQMIREIIETGRTSWRQPNLPTRDALIAYLLGMHIDIGVDIEKFVNPM